MGQTMPHRGLKRSGHMHRNGVNANEQRRMIDKRSQLTQRELTCQRDDPVSGEARECDRSSPALFIRPGGEDDSVAIQLQRRDGLRHFAFVPAFKEPARRRLNHDVVVSHTVLHQPFGEPRASLQHDRPWSRQVER